MTVRIGVSLGPAGTPEAFADVVDLLEQAGVDSVWLPEMVYSPLVEPFTGMTFALARTRRLKAGTGLSVLPAGWDGARRMIGQYVEAGLSKFVVRPAAPAPAAEFIDGVVRKLLPLQN